MIINVASVLISILLKIPYVCKDYHAFASRCIPLPLHLLII